MDYTVGGEIFKGICRYAPDDDLIAVVIFSGENFDGETEVWGLSESSAVRELERYYVEICRSEPIIRVYSRRG